jgi:hypothetical protein
MAIWQDSDRRAGLHVISVVAVRKWHWSVTGPLYMSVVAVDSNVRNVTREPDVFVFFHEKPP